MDESNTSFSTLKSRVKSSAEAFLSNPFSGATLRALVTGHSEPPETEQVTGLAPPTRCEDDAPVIVAHYLDYTAEHVPTYWHSVLPEIERRYGGKIRYEHHDAPPVTGTDLSYQLATIGRCIQHHRGDAAFWDWFDLLMDRGATSLEDAYELGVELDLDRETLEEAVDEDRYKRVLRHDTHSAFAHLPSHNHSEAQPGDDDSPTDDHPSDPIFIVLVNGTVVQPTYESIAGAIERFKFGSP